MPSSARGPTPGSISDRPLIRNSLIPDRELWRSGCFGAALWIIGADLFSLRDVGEASSLFAATALIGQLSLLGLKTELLRYLPTAERRDELVTACSIRRHLRW